MITSTRRRRVRLGAALTLAGALVLAPVTAFAAEPGADAPTSTGAEEAQRTAETGTVVESPAPSDTAASTPAADPADASGTPASTPAASTPAAEAPTTEAPAAETPAPAETPVADATEDATDAAAATDETAGAEALAAGELMNYVVNVDPTEPATAAARDAVVAAGGVVLMSYPEIGVVTAQSTDDGFLDAIRASSGVQSAGPTRQAAVTEGAVPTGWAGGTLAIDRPRAEGGATAAPLESQQWDMTAIGAPEARSIEPGDSDVLVGVLDSGIDITHPDLATQVDPAASVGCSVNGIPDQDVSAWVPVDDSESHGTHVAGTIGANADGQGITGIAPGVTLASVKVVNYDGFIYPEYALCGFMWAAAEGMDVTNNSYYVDPWAFWCEGQPEQQPALDAVEKAVAWSQQQGVLNVAAAGNEDYDLANKTTESTSPDDGVYDAEGNYVSGPRIIEDRDVSQGCVDLPAGVDGVVTVASVAQQPDGSVAKSSFSNYGEGEIDIAAPGSAILSTVFGGRYDVYSGTSMASPHVAGVAALLASAHPDASPAELQALLTSQATDLGDTELYGAGLVDAFAAVTEDLDLGPIAAVADGTIQAGVPFRLRGANLTPGDVFVLSIATDGGTQPDASLDSVSVDENGDVDAIVTVPPETPTGPAVLSPLGGATTASFAVPVTVTAPLAGPVVTSPAQGAELEPGTVAVTGTGVPAARIQVVLATSGGDMLRSDDVSVTADSAAAALAAPASTPFDPERSLTFGETFVDAAGDWSIDFTSVPAGDYIVAGQGFLADDSVTLTGPAVGFSVVGDAAAVPDPSAPPAVDVPAGGVPPVVVPAGGPTALAYTGSESTPVVGAAAALVLAGLALTIAAAVRRRRPRAEEARVGSVADRTTD